MKPFKFKNILLIIGLLSFNFLSIANSAPENINCEKDLGNTTVKELPFWFFGIASRISDRIFNILSFSNFGKNLLLPFDFVSKSVSTDLGSIKKSIKFIEKSINDLKNDRNLNNVSLVERLNMSKQCYEQYANGLQNFFTKLLDFKGLYNRFMSKGIKDETEMRIATQLAQDYQNVYGNLYNCLNKVDPKGEIPLNKQIFLDYVESKTLADNQAARLNWEFLKYYMQEIWKRLDAVCHPAVKWSLIPISTYLIGYKLLWYNLMYRTYKWWHGQTRAQILRRMYAELKNVRNIADANANIRSCLQDYRNAPV
ncbi:hypothetical protein GF322_04380 [Candidatus Dependentiae bacterium]|nr:hypothetical protein [Candidatus Dependentiae bacterium]